MSEPRDQGTERYTSQFQRAARFIAQRGLLKPFIYSLLDVTVKGRENLAELDPPFIVVSNHSSHLDAPLIMTSLPYRLTKDLSAGAAADYFFDVWWRRGFTALMFNAFPIERGANRKGGGMSMKLLEDGVPLLIFPEGTRSKTGRMAPFTRGAAGLSQVSGVPVIPVALVGAYSALPKGRLLPHAGRPPVTVVCGKPMTARHGEELRSFSLRVEEAIREMLRAEGQAVDEPAEHPSEVAKMISRARNLAERAGPLQHSAEALAQIADERVTPKVEAWMAERRAHAAEMASGQAEALTTEELAELEHARQHGEPHRPSIGELEPVPSTIRHHHLSLRHGHSRSHGVADESGEPAAYDADETPRQEEDHA